MATKIYTYQSTRNHDPVLSVMRWLRSEGERDRDFRIHQLNYTLLRVEFLNSKLELAYTLKYEWASDEG